MPLATIATRAGVGIATMYRNFPTRADLLVEIVRNLIAQVRRTAEQFQPMVAADPDDGWPRFVRALAEVKPGALMPQIARGLVVEDLPADVWATREAAVAAIESVLTEARRAGLVREDVTPLRLQLGLAAITRPGPAPPRGLGPELADFPDWLLDTYLRGLRP